MQAAALKRLRQRLSVLEQADTSSLKERFGSGVSEIDDVLGGGLQRGALHEVLAAAPRHAAAASGFLIGLMQRAAGAEQSLVWIRQTYGAVEAGLLYGPGLAELGLDPAKVILVQLKTPAEVLQAGLEAARCKGVGAVAIEIWGQPKLLDLTATRRLSLAAGEAGGTVFLLRVEGQEQASAAATRWQLASGSSAGLAANAPGHPCFDVKLLRQRAGPAGQTWRLEWSRDTHEFARVTPLSRPVVSVPAGQPAAEVTPLFARTG